MSNPTKKYNPVNYYFIADPSFLADCWFVRIVFYGSWFGAGFAWRIFWSISHVIRIRLTFNHHVWLVWSSDQ